MALPSEAQVFESGEYELALRHIPHYWRCASVLSFGRLLPPCSTTAVRVHVITLCSFHFALYRVCV